MQRAPLNWGRQAGCVPYGGVQATRQAAADRPDNNELQRLGPRRAAQRCGSAEVTVSQPVMKFSSLYGTRSFITVLTTARHLSPS